MCPLVYLALLLAGALTVPAPKAELLAPNAFVCQCDAQADRLCRFFLNERVWQDDPASLIAHLRLVMVVRPKELLPVMVDRVNFRFPRQYRMLPLDKSHPVLPVIQSYGREAIPELIRRLKNSDFDSLDLLGRYHYDYVVICLTRVWDEPEFSIQSARLRIEYEIGKSSGQDKKNLLKALKHPLIAK